MSTGMAGLGAAAESWMFLGVRFDLLTAPGAPVTVAVMLLPEGASPPAHAHDGLDDSFYVLEGRMVVRCGDEVTLAGPGTWVQFPSGVPHTFRVLDGPVRALVVHANESFLGVVRELGYPAAHGNASAGMISPSPDEITRVMSAHGIAHVGPPMEHDEAQAHLGSLAPAGR